MSIDAELEAKVIAAMEKAETVEELFAAVRMLPLPPPDPDDPDPLSAPMDSSNADYGLMD